MASLKCPICKKAVSIGDPEFPFCSPRCRSIDLGNWAMEKYVISSPVTDMDLEEDQRGGSDEE